MPDIPTVNLAAIDLNLLVVVDAVLRDKSATRAAAHLGLTQSAVSNALRRARALFDDPLVVRTARGFVTTPRGEALAPRLRQILGDVEGALADGASFDPSTTTRRFTLAATDGIGIVFLPALLSLFRARMPRAQLRSVTLDHVIGAGGLEKANVDLLVGIPPVIPAGCECEDLFEEPMMAIVAEGHPLVARRLTLATYTRLPHAELALFGEPDERIDHALAAHGARRSVAVTTPHISGLPFLVAQSDLVATVMASVARAFAKPLALRVLRPPVALPALTIRQLWHRRSSGDPGHALLRDLVRATARRVFGRVARH